MLGFVCLARSESSVQGPLAHSRPSSHRRRKKPYADRRWNLYGTLKAQIALARRRRGRYICEKYQTFSGGGARRNRTDDLFNAIEALSQLSYGPIFSCRFQRVSLG